MALGPFDLSGGPFLFLYAALFVLAWIASIRVAQALRPEGRRASPIDDTEIAVLAGGLPRYSEVLAAELVAAGHLVVDRKQLLSLAADAPATPAVRTLRALPLPLRWHAVDRALGDLGRAIQVRLIDRGLLLAAGEAWRLRIAQALPFVLLAGFGLIKLGIGEARGRPVGFLVIALIVTVMVAVIRFGGLDTRTRAGQAILAEARRRHERLRRAPATGEVGLGVALFGTVVLVGSGWEDLHRLRSSGSDGGAAGSDGGSGCESGGCGGGGCGGCSS
ncbi:TIGR04222 domain-containing membrane protein [Sphingomonas elodea]|uniref:TIGR04222 domain-containing membrane protein n=1 Tax=Sphingomonas elodea TaxID=179878 RepID=UPI000686F9C2|nr:TIGR04222 domain-containing membrane protein [Sphingomonas elodea]